MPQTRESAIYAQRLILEYNRARKLLRKYFKVRHDPDEARAKIAEIISNMNARQSKIIGYTLNDAFKAGTKEGSIEISNATISAAAPTASVGFDLTKVADTHLNKITRDTIGSIGKYNSVLTNQLQLQYNTLLVDNTLMTKLAQTGWSPSIEKALQKRGLDPKVISLAKGQTTTKKIINMLEMEGIRGGRHPREVSKMLLPHIQRHFGPKGVIIDNVGKFKKVLKVDVDGNFKYVKQAITRPYRATPRAYSALLARSSMIQAHHEGRYQSLQKTGLGDHYISVSTLDANTCNLCAAMHGQRVSHSEGPLYHPDCHCRLKPIFRKDSGLKNKDPSYYDNQRDQHFWKQHQLAEYNKKMPRGAKLKFHSMLPKDALVDMPGKEAMRTIRYDVLGKPGAIKPKAIVKKVVKPTEVKEKIKKKVEEKEKVQKIVKKKIVKEKISKPKTLATMDDNEIADELWKKTAKDGNEHAILRNGVPRTFDGGKSAVKIERPDVPYESYHTHPAWDSPLSPGDISSFMWAGKEQKMVAASKKHIYSFSRTKKTPTISNFTAVKKKWSIRSDTIYKETINKIKKGELHMSTTDARRKALIQMNKEAAEEYNIVFKMKKR